MGEKKSNNMVSGERTVLTKANNRSYSLRTTVPTGIAKQFDLKDKDTILWKIKADQNGGLMIVVEPEPRKLKKEKKNKEVVE